MTDEQVAVLVAKALAKADAVVSERNARALASLEAEMIEDGVTREDRESELRSMRDELTAIWEDTRGGFARELAVWLLEGWSAAE
jgi:hypothetical protein